MNVRILYTCLYILSQVVALFMIIYLLIFFFFRFECYGMVSQKKCYGMSNSAFDYLLVMLDNSNALPSHMFTVSELSV